MTTFDVTLNDGPHRQITVSTGLYILAAQAAPALLGVEEFPVRVKIWIEDLQPEYPPLTFMIEAPGAAADQLVWSWGSEIRVLHSA